MLCRLVCAFYLSLLFNLILLQYKCPGDRVFGAALGLLAEHGSVIYIRVPGLLCQRSSVLVQSGARETGPTHVATQMVDPRKFGKWQPHAWPVAVRAWRGSTNPQPVTHEVMYTY